MAERYGCFVCTGCGIGEAVDVDALTEVATDEMGAATAKGLTDLCRAEGLGEVRAAIEAEDLDGVVLAACSGRDHVRTFQLPGVFLERANLREGVVWTHESGDEDTQMLAEDVIRMSLAKAKHGKVPEPQTVQVTGKVLVIGGGIAGLSAALQAARAGKEVVLVEKEAELGGFARKIKKVFPREAGVAAYESAPKLGELVDAVQGHEAITVLLGAEVGRIEGAPGMFDVLVNTAGSGEAKEKLVVDSVVLAAGWQPYDANKLGHLGYGESPNVVTNVEFEALAKEGKIVNPTTKKPVKSVLFVQCAGSRDDDHLPYCSNVCCGVSLKQVGYLKEQNKEIATYVVYKDIRATGHWEEVYKQAQKQGAIFVKGDVESVTPDGEGAVLVECSDVLLAEPLMAEVDMVVLATGMVPTTLDTDVLNLTYRQGPELPEREYGFPNSHFVCFPYETRRTGIYAAGTVRSPMDSATALDDGLGAAAKAVQASELIARGAATLPRVGDFSLPDFALQRCTQCKRCTEECPFGAIDEDAKGTPKPNPTRCRRCGVCMGACPERIINFANYGVGMISDMVQSMFVPDEFEEKPRALALACENDAIAALDMAAHNGLKLNPFVRVIPVRCLGSFNKVWVADALSNGIDGVMLMGCRFGDDYQCHFVKGSELASTRMANIQDTLDRLMLESERLVQVEIGITDYAKLPQIFDDFLDKLEELGPNPYKD